ncbi:MAG: polyphosphate--glucose phosphotransferase [Bacteroidota bacterium]
MENIRLGIDFGGSGIKGGLVDINKGELIGERHRIETPNPATPAGVSEVIQQIVTHFDYTGEIGVAFPAAIQNGVVKTASNIDKSWIGNNAETMFTQITKNPVKVMNDADAAGIAEMRFGHGRDIKGVALIVTIGSGLGTAIFTNGVLVPNTELGHIHYKNKVAEKWASDAVRKKQDLSWKKWGKRFAEYLQYMQKLFYPEIIILGGGASKKFDKYKDTLEDVETKVVPAHLQNQAGIIGSAAAVV